MNSVCARKFRTYVHTSVRMHDRSDSLCTYFVWILLWGLLASDKVAKKFAFRISFKSKEWFFAIQCHACVYIVHGWMDELYEERKQRVLTMLRFSSTHLLMPYYSSLHHYPHADTVHTCSLYFGSFILLGLLCRSLCCWCAPCTTS